MKKILAGLIFAVPLLASAYVSPGRPAGFVSDFAGVLSVAQKQDLENKITGLEKTTGAEIALVTIRDLGGDTVENFALKLFEEWKIGKAGKDNGVLILAAINDRRVRIEVGYGLEGNLTDLQSFWIIDNVIRPSFQKGDYYAGFDGAVDLIAKAISGGAPIPSASPEIGGDTLKGLLSIGFFVLIFGFRILAILLGRSRSWWGGGVLGAVGALILANFFGSIILNLILLVPLGLLFDFFVSRSYYHAQSMGHLPWWWFIGRGGRSGGHGGFGGFGGGRSGGGGSSGGW